MDLFRRFYGSKEYLAEFNSPDTEDVWTVEEKKQLEKLDTLFALMSKPNINSEQSTAKQKPKVRYDEFSWSSDDDADFNNDKEPFVCIITDVKEWVHMVSGLIKKIVSALMDEDNRYLNKCKVQVMKLNKFLHESIHKILQMEIPDRRHYRIEHCKNIQTLLQLIHLSVEITNFLYYVQIQEFVNKKGYDYVWNKLNVEKKAKVIICVGLFNNVSTILKLLNDHLFINYMKIRGMNKHLIHETEGLAIWLCIMRLSLIISEMCDYIYLFSDEDGLMKQTPDYYQKRIEKKQPLDDKLAEFVGSGFGVYDISKLETSSMQELKMKQFIDNTITNQNNDNSSEDTSSISSEDNQVEYNPHLDINTIEVHNKKGSRLLSFLYHYNIKIDPLFYDTVTLLANNNSNRTTANDIRNFIYWAQSNSELMSTSCRFVNEYETRNFNVCNIPILEMTTEEIWRSISVFHSISNKVERDMNVMLYIKLLWLRCCNITFYEQDLYVYDVPIFNKTVSEQKKYEIKNNGRVLDEKTFKQTKKTINLTFVMKIEGIIYHYMVCNVAVNMLRSRVERNLDKYSNLDSLHTIEQLTNERIRMDLHKLALHNGLKANEDELLKWVSFVSEFAEQPSMREGLIDMYGIYFVSAFLLPGELELHLRENPLLDDNPRIVLSTHRPDEYQKIEEEVRMLDFNKILDKHFTLKNGVVTYNMNDWCLKYNIFIRFVLEMASLKDKAPLSVKKWLIFENTDRVDIYYRVIFNKSRQKPPSEETVNPFVDLNYNDNDMEDMVQHKTIYEDAVNYINDLNGEEIQLLKYPIVLWSGHIYYVFYAEAVLIKCFNILDALKTWMFLMIAIDKENIIPDFLKSIFDVSKEIASFFEYEKILDRSDTS
jgi:hypothetical protein